MPFSLPWWFYAAIAVPIVWPLIERLAKELINERRFARAGLTDVKKMTGRDFENYLGHLFRGMGFKVEITPAAGDFGVDLILTDASGKRIAVQAKRWKQRVGNEAVQAVVGGAAYYKCQETMVVTTSGYTPKAVQMARETGTRLWDVRDLADAMDKVRARGTAAQNQVAATTTPVAKQTTTAPAPRSASAPSKPGPKSAQSLGLPVKPGAAVVSPLCQQCGTQMVRRKVEGRDIWLCGRFPACRGSKTID